MTRVALPWQAWWPQPLTLTRVAPWQAWWPQPQPLDADDSDESFDTYFATDDPSAREAASAWEQWQTALLASQAGTCLPSPAHPLLIPRSSPAHPLLIPRSSHAHPMLIPCSSSLIPPHPLSSRGAGGGARGEEVRAGGGAGSRGAAGEGEGSSGRGAGAPGIEVWAPPGAAEEWRRRRQEAGDVIFSGLFSE